MGVKGVRYALAWAGGTSWSTRPPRTSWTRSGPSSSTCPRPSPRRRSPYRARLPTLKSLYEDEEVLKKVPVAALGKASLENARPRPISPYYSDMSLVMTEYFNEALKGGTPVDQALRDMQGELQNVVDQT